MVNKYTAARRLRSEDAYSPDGRHDLRPEYPTIVYSKILRQLYPDVPIVLGGIEASLRRVMHYDYWKEKFMPSILMDSDADIITYGMGEKPTLMLTELLSEALADYHPSLFYDENGESLPIVYSNTDETAETEDTSEASEESTPEEDTAVQ